MNFIEGDVIRVDAVGKTSRIIKGDTIEVGERVTTGQNGKAEILLNPGSYIRLGSNSTFQFKTTDLEDLQLSLSSGQAVLEVFADDDFVVTVDTPGSKFEIIKTGIYTVASADGRSTISVWKGRALVNGNEAEPVKGGREATVSGENSAVAKFDRDERDSLEEWSKARSKELAKSTTSLKRRDLRGSLLSAYRGGMWDMYSSFGLWVYDPRFGHHCFLPFGYGWSSPYGYYYGMGIWGYGLPWNVYYGYPRFPGGNTGTPGTGTGSGGGGTTNPPTTNGPMNDRRGSVPPFQRMGGEGGRSGAGRMDRMPIGDTPPIMTPGPVFVPQAPSAPPASSRGSGTKPVQ
ncbi:MAG: FecR family protein [Pyrinomonadaceae bacterium]|nr:FecR family protein [Pyrinomonadaceae bacterium]